MQLWWWFGPGWSFSNQSWGTQTGPNGREAACLPLVSAGWERVQPPLTPSPCCRYVGKKSRIEAEQALLRQRDGVFLIRESDVRPGEYAIALK